MTVICRCRSDYYNFPKGENIKKEVPMKANLSCSPVRYKDYEGIYRFLL
jgi:hypothetical protein